MTLQDFNKLMKLLLVLPGDVVGGLVIEGLVVRFEEKAAMIRSPIFHEIHLVDAAEGIRSWHQEIRSAAENDDASHPEGEGIQHQAWMNECL